MNLLETTIFMILLFLFLLWLCVRKNQKEREEQFICVACGHPRWAHWQGVETNVSGKVVGYGTDCVTDMRDIPCGCKKFVPPMKTN